MLIDLPNNQTAWLIGDPHLGKKFENGVPLGRRGDRERRQRARFREELAAEADYVVMIGDLFDHPFVTDQAIHDAAEDSWAAARDKPDTTFIFLAGNHDRSRNLSVVGAWELFCLALRERLPNLYLLSEPTQVGPIACFPWQWGVGADEQARDFASTKIAIGHWAPIDFGPSKDGKNHVTPVDKFDAGTEFYTGHYHLPGTYPVAGVNVHCTGSMEPYSHGEDPEGETYITVTRDEIDDLGDVINKCVRVLLKPGEELPVGLDCFALTAKPVVEEAPDEDLTAKLGAFSWSKILDEHLKDVPDYVREFIDERIQVDDD